MMVILKLDNQSVKLSGPSGKMMFISCGIGGQKDPKVE